MNKELVEKMQKSIESCFLYGSVSVIENIVNKACAVASEHYGDKWTRVDDGLPEDMLPVLFIVRGKVIQGRFYKSDQWDIGNMFVCTQGGHFTGGEGLTSTVTHWMPLPQPPQQ